MPRAQVGSVKGKPMIVDLGLSLTLANATEMKRQLLALLQQHEAVILNARALVEIDVAGLQLLCATRRLATSHGKSVTLAPGGAPGLVAGAAAAGFGPGRGCPDDCLCVGGRS